MTEPKESSQGSSVQSMPTVQLLPHLDDIPAMSVDELKLARRRCRMLFHPKMVGLAFKAGFALIFLVVQMWAVVTLKPAVGGLMGFLLLVLTAVFIRGFYLAHQEVTEARRAVDGALQDKEIGNG